MVVNSVTGEVAQEITYNEFVIVIADSNPGFQPFYYAGGVYDLDAKIEFIQRDWSVTRKTAAKYLEELSSAGLLRKEKIGVSNFFVNESLFNFLPKREIGMGKNLN
jgi:hypothetical protein